MKKYFLVIVLLSLPLTTSAAFNTVQFTETISIYLDNGLTLQVLSGTPIDQINRLLPDLGKVRISRVCYIHRF